MTRSSPAMGSGLVIAALSRKRRRSAASQRVHDLDPVAVLQRVFRMQAARDDGAVDLHRDAPPGQVLRFEQGEHRAGAGQGLRLAVEDDVHAPIVARPPGDCMRALPQCRLSAPPPSWTMADCAPRPGRGPVPGEESLMSKSRTVRTALAAALALAALPAAAHDHPFTQTVFFGDSLTDAGYFRPLLPPEVQAVTGQFTTNPGLVWSQWLADFYGTAARAQGNGQTGTNFAAGGARNGVDVTGALGFTPSLATQAAGYLAANGGRADPNALYTVWGGANDLFAAAGDPANAPAIIGGAVQAQVGIVGSLQAAGARYVLVPNIPDLGLTPSFLAQGPGAAAQGTLLATTYNQALFGTLAANGLSVIPVDTFAFLREVVADPGLFGIVNTTGTACMPQITAQSLTCNPTSLVSPDAPHTYLFADGVHPASGAHRALADLAVGMIEGPRQIAVLPHSAAGTGRNRAARVAAQAGVRGDAAGARTWVDVRGDFQRYGHGDHYDGVGPALAVGMDWGSEGLSYGGFLGYGRQANDWGLHRGNWDQSELTLGGYLAWSAASGAWANAQ